MAISALSTELKQKVEGGRDLNFATTQSVGVKVIMYLRALI